VHGHHLSPEIWRLEKDFMDLLDMMAIMVENQGMDQCNMMESWDWQC